MGRGRTIAANLPSPASGSENPASLNDSHDNVTYATTLVGISSDLDKETERASDPLRNRTLQYFSMMGEKGVLFYEPISRYSSQDQITGVPSGTRDVEYQANAIGVAGAEKWRAGSFGLSIAYLWSSLSAVDHVPGQADVNTFDTADGLRLNIGVRHPTGPFMWGMVLQNMPAFLWGSSYKRQMLPPLVRVGNTWRPYAGMLFSVDYEHRFYNEGGDGENFLYVGSEIFSSERVVLRGGVFGTDIGKSEERHFTAGIGFRPRPGLELSYAYDSYKVLDETINRSLVSLKYPFDTAIEEKSGR
jgi:hypothetical protein